MATRETRLDHGKRRGRHIAAKLLNELRTTRTAANVSVRAVAHELGWSHARYARFENNEVAVIGIGDMAAAGAILGLDLTADLYPSGFAIRDRGQQALAERFKKIPAATFRVTSEVLFPNPGDRRSWDLLLRLGSQLTGVELETRIRDMQALVRKTRERERDGGVDHVLLVLSASAHNRRFLAELLEALGPRFQTPARQILRALREGKSIPGSGVILL